MRSFFVSVSFCCLNLFIACSPVSADLVINGGFETGDFTGWNYRSTTLDSFVASGFSHGGNYAAFFGDSFESGGGSISQLLATTASLRYTLSFWFAGDGDTPSGFSALVGGNTLFNVTNPSYDANYNLYSFNFTATSGSTLLQFNFYDDPFYINLDDVSVSPLFSTVPEPSSAALFGLGLLALAASYMHSRHTQWKRLVRMRAPATFTR